MKIKDEIPSAQPNPLDIRQTPGGVRYGLLGSKQASPAPTLFVLGGAMASNLTEPHIRSGRELQRDHGFLCVSLDSPSEGSAVRPAEPYGLDGWRCRLEHDEDFTIAFSRDASAVLDDLIAKGYTDPDRVALVGISRGGFLGLHFAAADSRIRCLALVAPVTDLRTLREFRGMDDNPVIGSLAVVNRAEPLAGRAVWFIIGDRDERVGTDHTIALARRLSKLAMQRGVKPQVVLHVVPADGHANPDGSHAMAARWIASMLPGR